MTRYVAVLEKEPDSLWSVWFPDLPGCVTAAATMDEALDRAPQALRLWIEDAIESGEELPEARRPDQLREDADFAQSLADGAVAVLVPLIVERGRSVRVNITMDAGALEAIDEAAKGRGVTRSAFLVSSALDKIVGRS